MAASRPRLRKLARGWCLEGTKSTCIPETSGSLSGSMGACASTTSQPSENPQSRLSHTGLSAAHCILKSRPQAAIVFNVANTPFARLLDRAGIPNAIHIDGLEWKRSKWNGVGAKYFKLAERWAARSESSIIADAEAIRAYVSERYGRPSVMIPYGTKRVECDPQHLDELMLNVGEYHLMVARFEPENHVQEIIESFATEPNLRWPLVVVGGAAYAGGYVDRVHETAATNPRVRILGSIWDQDQLNSLYAGAGSYVHGHSVGGTNPSLLRALAAGAPVIAHDNPFNREVCGQLGTFFTGRSSLRSAFCSHERSSKKFIDASLAGIPSVLRRYDWDRVALDYERLLIQLEAKR